MQTIMGFPKYARGQVPGLALHTEGVRYRIVLCVLSVGLMDPAGGEVRASMPPGRGPDPLERGVGRPLERGVDQGHARRTPAAIA
jgi:hypothetical protein